MGREVTMKLMGSEDWGNIRDPEGKQEWTDVGTQPRQRTPVCLSQRGSTWRGVGAHPAQGTAHLWEPLPVHMIHHDDLIVEGSCGASGAEGG